MSQHPSLRSKTKDTIQRSVLKRYERIREMFKKEAWDEKKSVFGLPKLKVIKFKLKKEKPAETAAEGTEGAAEATAAAGGTPGKASAAKEAPKAEAKGKADKKK